MDVELDCEEGWALKNWCFWTAVLGKTLESPFDCKEIKPVNPKGNQSWVFTERTDGEAPVLWSPDAKRRFIGKHPNSGKDWKQEEKGTPEDEMAGWHHCLDGHEFEWTLGVGDGQGGLACCNSWGHKESDTTERLNWYWEHEPRASPSKNYQLLECKSLHTENKRKHLCWTLHWVSVHVAEKKDRLQWI